MTQTHPGVYLCTYRYTLHWVVYSFALGRSLPPSPDIDRGDLPVKDDISVDTLRDIWNPIKNFLWEWSKLITLVHTSLDRSLQILWNAFDGRLGTRCQEMCFFIEIWSFRTCIIYIKLTMSTISVLSCCGYITVIHVNNSEIYIRVTSMTSEPFQACLVYRLR